MFFPCLVCFLFRIVKKVGFAPEKNPRITRWHPKKTRELPDCTRGEPEKNPRITWSTPDTHTEWSLGPPVFRTHCLAARTAIQTLPGWARWCIPPLTTAMCLRVELCHYWHMSRFLLGAQKKCLSKKTLRNVYGHTENIYFPMPKFPKILGVRPGRHRVEEKLFRADARKSAKSPLVFFALTRDQNPSKKGGRICFRADARLGPRCQWKSRPLEIN